MGTIVSFEVTGLGAQRRNVSQSLNGSVNVFWGTNGCGKTSLLRILHSAMENNAAGLKRVPFESAEVYIQPENSRDLVRRTITKLGNPSIRDSARVRTERSRLVSSRQYSIDGIDEWNWESNPEKDDSNFGQTRYSHAYLSISRVAESRLIPNRLRRELASESVFGDEYFDSVFAEQVKYRWTNYNSEALQRVQEVQQHGIAQILTVLLGGSNGRVRGRSTEYLPSPLDAYQLVTSFLRTQDLPIKIGKKSFTERYERQAELREVVANISDVMREISAAFTPQWKFQELIQSLYSEGKRVEFTTRGIEVFTDDGEALQLESLSSGERQILQILLEALAADRSSVIVDEPELSLHVDWQRRLVESMVVVNPHCQLILATHSPEILATVPQDSIFEL